MQSSCRERPATTAGAHRVCVSLKRSSLSVATVLLLACGGSDWQRPRSASDPADPSAPEAPPRPPPTTLATVSSAPMPTLAHAHLHHETGGPAAQPAATTAPGSVVYICPMHAQIVRSEPGKCPLCGMDLAPKAAAEGKKEGR